MHDIVLSNPLIILYRGFCPCSKDRDVFKEYKFYLRGVSIHLKKVFLLPDNIFFYVVLPQGH